MAQAIKLFFTKNMRVYLRGDISADSFLNFSFKNRR